MLNPLLECAELLHQNGLEAEVVKLNRITPIELKEIEASVRKTVRLLVAEESTKANCVGQRIAAGLLLNEVPVQRAALVNVGDGIVPHGAVGQLRKLCGLDGESLYHKALEVCGHGDG